MESSSALPLKCISYPTEPPASICTVSGSDYGYTRCDAMLYYYEWCVWGTVACAAHLYYDINVGVYYGHRLCWSYGPRARVCVCAYGSFSRFSIRFFLLLFWITCNGNGVFAYDRRQTIVSSSRFGPPLLDFFFYSFYFWFINIYLLYSRMLYGDTGLCGVILELLCIDGIHSLFVAISLAQIYTHFSFHYRGNDRMKLCVRYVPARSFSFLNRQFVMEIWIWMDWTWIEQFLFALKW